MGLRKRNISSFPSHFIDPRLKNYKWVLNFIKAAYGFGGSNNNIFYNYAWKYDEIKSFALGEQPISSYKKQRSEEHTSELQSH